MRFKLNVVGNTGHCSHKYACIPASFEFSLSCLSFITSSKVCEVRWLNSSCTTPKIRTKKIYLKLLNVKILCFYQYFYCRKNWVANHFIILSKEFIISSIQVCSIGMSWKSTSENSINFYSHTIRIHTNLDTVSAVVSERVFCNKRINYVRYYKKRETRKVTNSMLFESYTCNAIKSVCVSHYNVFFLVKKKTKKKVFTSEYPRRFIIEQKWLIKFSARLANEEKRTICWWHMS